MYPQIQTEAPTFPEATLQRERSNTKIDCFFHFPIISYKTQSRLTKTAQYYSLENKEDVSEEKLTTDLANHYKMIDKNLAETSNPLELIASRASIRTKILKYQTY